MRYWLDTEFVDDGRSIDLISIGIVAEDRREYYAVSTEFDPYSASDWVVNNVFPQLPDMWSGKNLPSECKSRQQISKDIRDFVYGVGTQTEFWGYYADYDWVAFCQLFGTMMDLPKGFPMYCRDIKQWCDELGNPELPSQLEGEHHALADAKWNKQAWQFLRTYSEDCVVDRR